VAAKIRYDLSAAQAKLTELVNMLASLNLPSEEVPYSLERGEEYVRKVGYLYTDYSLEADLRERGADDAHVSLLLALAAKRRGEVGGFIKLPGGVAG
jgi:hypothetical protein